MFIGQQQQRLVREALLCAGTLMLVCAGPASADPPGMGFGSPMSPNVVPPAAFATAAATNANAMVAQAPPPATSGGIPQPIDLTPVRLPEQDREFSTMQQFRTNALYFLPAKMFFNANVENSLRLETNAFYREHKQRQDGVYRVIPDVTLGYAPTKTTRVSANYFMFRDTYFDFAHSLSRTVHSIALRGDKDFVLNENTVLTASYMQRELFITRSKALHDILPSLSLVHRVGTYGAIYGSVLGQIRWQNMVGGKFQEGDQFYSVGAIYKRPRWYSSFDTTLIDQFGKGNLRPGPNNNHMFVLTGEVGRRIWDIVPTTAFVRVQPIFNFGADSSPGYSGFNLRLFGGLRTEISKPAIFPMKVKGT